MGEMFGCGPGFAAWNRLGGVPDGKLSASPGATFMSAGRYVKTGRPDSALTGICCWSYARGVDMIEQATKAIVTLQEFNPDYP
ncbi:MAG: hypothetical protein QG662_68 [Pseudomonadota bacterium]|nr:hypothetical protein [Pseudomonadota bacterium]